MAESPAKGPVIVEGNCPECGRDLAGLDVRAHTLYHWPHPIPPERQELDALAHKRRSQMMKLAAKQRQDADVEGS